jgi:hypothetical protein
VAPSGNITIAGTIVNGDTYAINGRWSLDI